MNIFVTDSNPCTASAELDDKRQNKLIIECAQMLSTALRIHTNDDPEICQDIYKATHVNHRCSKWVRETRDNFTWLVAYASCMSNDYTHRSFRVHKCRPIIMRCSWHQERIPEGRKTPFVNAARNKAMGLDFTHVEDIHSAYRQYLIERWVRDKRMPKWSNNRGAPEWAKEPLREVYGHDAIPDRIMYEYR